MRIYYKILIQNLFIAIIPVLIVMLLSLTFTKEEMQRLSANTAMRELQISSDKMANYFSEMQTNISLLSRTDTIRTMDWQKIKPYLQSENKQLSHYFEKFILGKTDSQYYTNKVGNPHLGGLSTHDNKSPTAKPKTIKKRRYWQETILTEAPVVYTSEPMVSYSTGVRQIVVASSILNENDKVHGMIGGAVSWKEIENFVTEIQQDMTRSLGSEAKFALISSKGTYIYHWEKQKGLKYKKDNTGKLILNDIGEPEVSEFFIQNESNPQLANAGKQLLAGDSGFTTYDVDGESQLFVYVPVKGTYYFLGISIPEKVMLEPLTGLRNSYYAITTSLVVIILISSFYFSRRISRPLEKLTEESTNFKGQAIQLDESLKGNDEIGLLATSFEQMTSDIVHHLTLVNEQKAELKLHKENLQDKIKDQTAELHNALAKAETANQAKSDFLANMSHEIRTPMNAILGFTEILHRKTEDPKYLYYIKSIHSSGKSLLGLINDILDLSKVEAGKLELQYSPVSLKELFDELQTLFFQKANEKDLDLIFDSAPNIPNYLLIDQARVRQVLTNLIGNAIKFTERGKVTIKASCQSSSEKRSLTSLILEVEDTGVGIPEDELDKVFNSFEQIAGQNAAKFGGTGLGLAITKRLVELMNGCIYLESKLNKGSIFKITLNEIEIPQEVPKNVKDINYLNIKFQPAKILIADDIDFNRELIRTYLEDHSFIFCEAENGKEVLQNIESFKPDLVLLDMKMPEMDGYEVSRHLRQDSQYDNLPLIAVTASALKKDERTIRECCNGYIPKPLSKEQLIKSLMTYLDYKITDKKESLDPDLTAKPLSAVNLRELINQCNKSLTPLITELSQNPSNYNCLLDTKNQLNSILHRYPENSLVNWQKEFIKASDSFNSDRILELTKIWPQIIDQFKIQLAS